MRANEIPRMDKHTPRTAGRVEDTSAIGFDDFDDETDMLDGV